MKKLILNTRLNHIVYLLLVACFISSCKKDAQSTVQNGNFKLEFLFNQNGCKMYRFQDGSRYIYWCDCEGRVQSDYTTSNGKSQTTNSFESVTSK